MAKRKRIEATPAYPLSKKAKHIASSNATSNRTSLPTISRFFENVLTLKVYVLKALPAGSKLRVKRILSFEEQSSEHSCFLNNTLLGLSKHTPTSDRSSHHAAFKNFTRTQRAIRPGSLISQHCTLDEIIEFVLANLFKGDSADRDKSRQILCHGLERVDTVRGLGQKDYRLCFPEIVQRYENPGIAALKQPLWRQLLALLGADGDTIFIEMLLDCAIFEYVTVSDSYVQICGVPVHELLKKPCHEVLSRKPSQISLVRGRILYGKPILGKNGQVVFGLSRLHILYRTLDTLERVRDRVLMRYIFPRQFKLHNVFTSKVDRTETTQPFKDYTVREDVSLSKDGLKDHRIPSRLCPAVLLLIRQLQRRYRRCCIDQLLYHHCPVTENLTKCTSMANLRRHDGTAEDDSKVSEAPRTQRHSTAETSTAETSTAINSSVASSGDLETSLLPYAVESGSISAFCRAVLRKLLPPSTFGIGEDGVSNWTSILSHVNQFVRLRRYETLSLCELVKGLKLKTIHWLVPKDMSVSTKLSINDKKKREELLQEWIYYVFDSLLIPLIATNFYVTESGIHRNKLFYFRHDVWMRLTQPHLVSVKLGSFVPVHNRQLQQLMSSGNTAYSAIRLLPKEKGIRTITNLKRRAVVNSGGKRILAVSTNTKLEPVFRILQREKESRRLNSMDPQDLYQQLLSFKAKISQKENASFYFVKVDIQSAFDSIPQENLLTLAEELFRHEDYTMAKHATIKMLSENSAETSHAKYGWSANPSKSVGDDSKSGFAKKHVLYVDTGKRYSISALEAKKRLETHIQNHVIKIGNQYQTSTRGIPQGSILSSFLCTFFYDDFEKMKLSFLQPDSSLLLRVIDDFLLITTNKADAIRFVNVMRAGDVNYGIVVHPEKSLVNFDSAPCGVQIPKLMQTTRFPFCGLLIDTRNLEVSKDRVRKDNAIANTLSVDTHNHAGKKMIRKSLVSLKIQLKNILLDSDLNNYQRILQSLIECFQETAMKVHRYIMHISSIRRPGTTVLIQLIQQLINYCFNILKERSAKTGFAVTRPQMSHLASLAFCQVLRTKQTVYTQILLWLDGLRTETQHSLGMSSKQVSILLEKSSKALSHYVY